MLIWKDVTDTFSESRRHWKGRYLEICEVANNEIELSLFSSETDDWEIYVSYDIMFGISYVNEENAAARREQMKKEIEAEFEKHGMEISDQFIHDFAGKYGLDIMNAFF